MGSGIDRPTVEGFGFEWSIYDQSGRDESSLRASFARYFSIFPWAELADDACGVDVGCGTGRWARLAAERGVTVIGVDPAPEALAVAASHASGCDLLRATAVDLPIRSQSLDFAFCLGVLHHVNDTVGALVEIRRVLKPGAPLLVYLYYAFDDRPRWFRAVWRATDIVRLVMSRLPPRVRLALTRVIAATVYLPSARFARWRERRGHRVDSIPLSAYRDQPFYVMQTDALDRFGTRLEKRYSRADVEELLNSAGFGEVEFSERWPFWCAVTRA